ncbi:MAG: DUF945 family protein [Pseudomonadota bacterium]
MIRKVLFALSAVLILLGLFGPLATGLYGERIVKEHQQKWAALLPDWLELVETELDRGWFASTARQRFVITDPKRAQVLRGILGDGVFGDQPAVIVDSHITHGPFVNLYTVAIAQLQTAFKADNGAEALVDLPAVVTSTLGFTGNSRFHWLVAPGQFNTGGGQISWQTLRMRQSIKPRSGLVELHLDTDALQLSSPVSQLALVAPSIDLAADHYDGHFVMLDGRYSTELGFTSDADRDRIEGVLDIDGIDVTMFDELQRIIDALNVPGASFENVAESHLADIRRVLANAVTLSWQQQLDGATGGVDTDVQLQLPDTQSLSPTMAAAAFLRTVATLGNLSLRADMDAAYVDAHKGENTPTGQQVRMLLGIGALQQADTGQYEMLFELSEGKATINGAHVGGVPQ